MPSQEIALERYQAQTPQNVTTSLMTLLGLVEGDILDYLEIHGPASLRRLIQRLEWPANIITMAVGSLIRHGLVHGEQRELEIMLEAETQHVSHAIKSWVSGN